MELVLPSEADVGQVQVPEPALPLRLRKAVWATGCQAK